MTRDSSPAGRSMARRTAGADRGVSFTVGYVLTIAIAVVLIAGVVIAVGQVVDDRRNETVRGGATVVGDQTAAAVMEVDRLARHGGESNVSIALRLPARLAGQPYTVSLRADATDAFVVVRTESPSVSVRTPLTNSTHLTETTVTGDDIRIVHRADEGQVTLAGDGA